MSEAKYKIVCDRCEKIQSGEFSREESDMFRLSRTPCEACGNDIFDLQPVDGEEG